MKKLSTWLFIVVISLSVAGVRAGDEPAPEAPEAEQIELLKLPKKGDKPDKPGPKETVKKKTKKKAKKKESSYKFQAEDSSHYKYDERGKPITGKKAAAGKTKKKSGTGGYKFQREETRSQYKFDETANPIGKTSGKKAPAPKKKAAKNPAAEKAGAEKPPPYDDSLSVDDKTINLGEE